MDTGADESVLMPIDGQRMGIDYSKLTGSADSVGFGGISQNYIEMAALAFSEPRTAIHVYFVDLHIAEPMVDIISLPSVLGRDILDRWQMNYHPTEDVLEFTVLGADASIPLKNSP